jgi:D-glycero-D-manno-heptose 1,7-bisphosphate phosphatase
VTNQSGIGRGIHSEKDFINFQNYFNQILMKHNAYINDIEYCPYHPNALIKFYRKKSNLRKPNDQMIKNLKMKWRINQRNSFYIGDSIVDKKTAIKSNLRFQYVDTNVFHQVKKLPKKIIKDYNH